MRTSSMPNLQTLRGKMLFFNCVSTIRFTFLYAACPGQHEDSRKLTTGGLPAGTWYSNSPEGQRSQAGI